MSVRSSCQASDELKLRGALASEADAVVADLEDAVVAHEKDAARARVQEVFGATPAAARPLRLIRVNGADSPFFPDDLAAVAAIGPDAVVLPKARPEAVDELGADGPPVVAIIETAQGVVLAERRDPASAFVGIVGGR
jgi:citrate lyase subunit beta/citryl-CoA lyase